MAAGASALSINVLVIQTDQHRWDCLSCAGNPDLRTPHLDTLARDGVQFTNSYCAFPVCTPSRYSLLSGLYVHQHGGYGNRATLAQGIDTFPRALRRAGYRTAGVGKMHFTPTYLDVGLSELCLAEQDGDGRLDDDYHRDLLAHDLADLDDVIDQRREFRQRAPQRYWETFGAGRSNLPEAWHSTTWIGDRAVEALERWDPHGGNLLYASFIKPHHPFDPPVPWDALYQPDQLTLPPGWQMAPDPADVAFHAGYFPHESLTEAALRRVMAHYYGTISHVDQQVGRMLEVLRQRGQYERTLIVFTSDHGEYLGFRHLLLKGGQMYEPLIRVPLLLKPPTLPAHVVPGANTPGSKDTRLVSTVDVAPSILRACGIEPPTQMRGLDLLDPRSTRDAVFVEAGRGRYAVRMAQRKLLLSREPADCRLYDLEHDPLETHNCYAEAGYAEAARALRDRLADWLLFDAPPATYRDDGAPQIDAPNVPTDGQETRRRRLLAHYEQMMEAR